MSGSWFPRQGREAGSLWNGHTVEGEPMRSFGSKRKERSEPDASATPRQEGESSSKREAAE